MEILDSKIKDILVLAFKGRLDAHTAGPAQAKLMAFIERGEKRVILDLCQLDYISSAGLHLIMTAAKRLTSSQGKLVLCSLPERVRETFDLAGFTALLPIFRTRTDAERAFTSALSP